MSKVTPKIFGENFARIYELIEGCDDTIATLRRMGENDDSPLVKQEKYLRNQYIEEFKKMLSNTSIGVYDKLAA